MEQSIVIGLVFTVFAVGVPYVFSKVKQNGNFKLNFSLPKLQFLRRKEIEEKMKEIDKKLEEVASSGVTKKDEGSKGEEVKVEKIKDLSEIEEVLASKAEEVKVDEDLLEEMQTSDKIKEESESTEEEKKLPDVPELPEPPSDLNADLEIDTEDIDAGFKLDSEDENESENENEEEIDLDEKDDLISSLEKEIAVEEEEEIDLLRDLKGQKFDVHELESELNEVLQKLKVLSSKASKNIISS